MHRSRILRYPVRPRRTAIKPLRQLSKAILRKIVTIRQMYLHRGAICRQWEYLSRWEPPPCPFAVSCLRILYERKAKNTRDCRKKKAAGPNGSCSLEKANALDSTYAREYRRVNLGQSVFIYPTRLSSSFRGVLYRGKPSLPPGNINDGFL